MHLTLDEVKEHNDEHPLDPVSRTSLSRKSDTQAVKHTSEELVLMA